MNGFPVGERSNALAANSKIFVSKTSRNPPTLSNCGIPNAFSSTRCLLGWCSRTESTPDISFFEGTGTLERTTVVCYVLLNIFKPPSVCSLNVLSAMPAGPISTSNGTFHSPSVSCWSKQHLNGISLCLEKSPSWPPRTFGNRETIYTLKESSPL